MARTALITGSATGIGKAVALKLASQGYNIAVNSLNESGEQTAKECRELGVESENFIADVTNFEQCAEMVKAVVKRFGSLDVLVNNAGITKDGLLPRMSEENFDAVINVNLKGVFNMCRHASGVMIKQRGGRIINVSSVAGVYGNAGQFNYSASKAGVVGMTKTAAKELGGRGITVNAVAPGFIQTAMTDVLPEKTKEMMLEQIALGRFGKPEDVAAAIAFFASEEAGYITGQVLVIDGCIRM
ncbi:3-oxoacyl-[acyl-carrier-protein] reductase [Hydrogenoanaerobacterium saccharovorans]|uniref:3-oxoacyl-[acyl-carrier-protein] reductase n=1 Tax=Hydrogenoanaerobacterium saccharovorans TaxID=474960 RepID=A0A1H8CQP8_9FIRM|nr:3-oxoacyl-[acyl-carrier-protein] reductase [Hydrogenoanaerobacterium saccharovorans]RPF43262.1 3-oxoacyl-[acyl-carrier-protein] reductase [Hydrogenoanaerobacterium saccharovorans]SEM97340.1 3-oxoacyl-[acyl-carrier-protein] reductase [Hydrogenoanaerobacterium saccharovorans]